MTDIVYARRTPIGRFLGGLSTLKAPLLTKPLIADALKTLAISGDEVEEIFMGQVLQAGTGQAPARQAAIYGGLPSSVCATTINRVCGSGLKAVMLAEQTISYTPTPRLFMAGGQENMSLAPHLLPQSRRGQRFGEAKLLDHMQLDGLSDPYEDVSMGYCGELCAQKYNFSREEQDAYALNSYQRAIAAWENGNFGPEVVAVQTGKQLVAKDEEPFAVNLAKISSLRPAFAQDGTITAGNSSSISDGAALVVLTNGETGHKPLARIVAHASHAQEPSWFTTAPITAITKVCAKANLQMADIDLFEINEAFAVVPMAAIRELNLDHTKVNVCGGAVSMGHPIGASGARILVTLIHALAARQKKYGLAVLCIGGGEASAMIVENLQS